MKIRKLGEDGIFNQNLSDSEPERVRSGKSEIDDEGRLIHERCGRIACPPDLIAAKDPLKDGSLSQQPQ